MIKTHNIELVEARSGRVSIRQAADHEGVYNITVRTPIYQDEFSERSVGAFHANDLESLFDALGELVQYRQAGEEPWLLKTPEEQAS